MNIRNFLCKIKLHNWKEIDNPDYIKWINDDNITMNNYFDFALEGMLKVRECKNCGLKQKQRDIMSPTVWDIIN